MKNALLFVYGLMSLLFAAVPLKAHVWPIGPSLQTARPVSARPATGLAPDPVPNQNSVALPDRLVSPRDSIGPGDGRVLGVLLDSMTHQPVSFATVAVVDRASGTLTGGTAADAEGRFVLTGLAVGSYQLRISFVGYRSKQTGLSITPQQPEVRLDSVWLRAEVRLLKAVEVIAQKDIVEEKEDRLVYNADKDVTVQDGNAADVLRKVPLLTVDLDGNISLRGSQNLRVLINNKPSALVTGSLADALKQIPADQIKAIEVMTSPSAKYDAEGSAGVINIVLKKNTSRGFSLGLDTGLGNRGGSLGVNSGLRVGKMGFSLGGSGWLNYNIQGAFANTQTAGRTVASQRADTRSRAQAGQYTLGWDYDLTKTNTLATSVRFGLRNNYARQHNLTTQALILGQFFPQYEVRNVTTQDLSRSVDVNTVYTHTFKFRQELSLLALYSQNSRINQFTADQLSWVDRTRVTGRDRNENLSLNEETTLQADFQTAPDQQPVWAKWLLEVGAKVIARRVNSDYTYLRDSSGQSSFVANPLFPPNGLRYQQKVLAGYVSYRLSFHKQYTLQVGIRYEHTTINARYQRRTAEADSTPGQLSLPDYGSWLPSLALSKSLKDGKRVKLVYNRRLQRPGIQFLNPNLNVANPLSVIQGNPLVSPERTHNVELSTGTTVKRLYVNVALFARFTNQAIQPVRDSVKTPIASADQSERTTVIRTNYQNIGREQVYGVNLTANGTPFATWQVGGGLDVYYAYLTNRSMNSIKGSKNAGWVLAGRLSSSLLFKRGWSIQGFGLLLGKQVQLQGYQGGFTFYMLGVKKELANKRGSLGLAAENFFNHPFTVRTELKSPILSQHTMTSYYNAGVRITFSYRLGKQKQESIHPTRKAINNDDVKGGVEKIEKQ
jgi:outer membrane receptor protein involved in Fe transport